MLLTRYTTNNVLDDKVDKAIILSDGIDLNTIKISGFYRLNSNHANMPANCGGAQLIVSAGGTSVQQIIISNGMNTTFTRTGVITTNTWGTWAQLLKTADVVDNLASTITNSPLSANQGRLLNNYFLSPVATPTESYSINFYGILIGLYRKGKVVYIDQNASTSSNFAINAGGYTQVAAGSVPVNFRPRFMKIVPVASSVGNTGIVNFLLIFYNDGGIAAYSNYSIAGTARTYMIGFDQWYTA